MAHIFTVGELTRAVKQALEAEFPFVWVQGQVSNVTRPGSGHIYFTLKDETSALSVVWFKSNQWIARDGGAVHPVTGEVLESGAGPEIEEGREVLCAGRIGVYEPRGAYQLVAELVQEVGVGELALAFEALKRKLDGLGYFRVERKRPLPINPRRVAVVTSPGGAAVRDFLRIASTRGLPAEIRIHPVLVQGDKAPVEIAEALERIGREGWAQVAVLTRGGGSLEDLWAFNTEDVARAVFECPVPVVSAVGHEVDWSISDFTADLRAATPSHAAQELWPPRRELAQGVDELENRMNRAFDSFLSLRDTRLEQRVKALNWLSPARSLERAEDRVEDLSRRLPVAMDNFLSRREQALEGAARLPRIMGNFLTGRELGLDRSLARLSAVDPSGPLKKGFAMLTDSHGRVIKDAARVRAGDEISLGMRDGSILATANSVQLFETEPEHEEG